MSLKKILALVLVLAMCASLFPASAFADNGVEPENEQITEPVEETQPEAEPADNTPAEETEEGNEPAPVEGEGEEPASVEGEGEEPASEEEEIVVEEEVEETETVVDEAMDATIVAKVNSVEGETASFGSLKDAIVAAGSEEYGVYGEMTSVVNLVANDTSAETIEIAKTVSIEGAFAISAPISVSAGTGETAAAVSISGATLNNSLTISGGTVTLSGVTTEEFITVSGGTISIDSGTYFSVLTSGEGEIIGKVTGGTFSKIATVLLADGYVTSPYTPGNATQKGEVAWSNCKAMLGKGATRTYYETLADAIAAAKTAAGEAGTPEIPVLIADASYKLTEANSPLKVKENGKTLTVTTDDGFYADRSFDGSTGITTYTLKSRVATVTIGEAVPVNVASLKEAVELINAAESHKGTITLYANINMGHADLGSVYERSSNQLVLVPGADVTILGYGHTITWGGYVSSWSDAINEDGALFPAIKNSVRLSFQNVKFVGVDKYTKVISTYSGFYDQVVSFSGCEFSNIFTAAYLNDAANQTQTVSITGSTFDANCTGFVAGNGYEPSKWNVTVTGNTYNAESFEITMPDGATVTFASNDFTNVKSISTYSNGDLDLSGNYWGGKAPAVEFNGAGALVISDFQETKGAEAVDCEAFIEVGVSGGSAEITYFKTFAEAAVAVQAGQIITLDNNVAATYPLDEDETLLVKKGEYDLTVTYGGIFVVGTYDEETGVTTYTKDTAAVALVTDKDGKRVGYYKTFDETMSVVPDQGTITMFGNGTWTSNNSGIVLPNKTIVIDIGGDANTLTLVGRFNFVDGANITFKNGNVSVKAPNEGWAVFSQEDGSAASHSLVFDDVNLSTSGDQQAICFYGVTTTGSASLVIKNNSVFILEGLQYAVFYSYGVNVKIENSEIIIRNSMETKNAFEAAFDYGIYEITNSKISVNNVYNAAFYGISGTIKDSAITASVQGSTAADAHVNTKNNPGVFVLAESDNLTISGTELNLTSATGKAFAECNKTAAAPTLILDDCTLTCGEGTVSGIVATVPGANDVVKSYTIFAEAAAAAHDTEAVLSLEAAPAEGDVYTLSSGTLQVKLHGNVEDATTLVTAPFGKKAVASDPDADGVVTISLEGKSYNVSKMVDGEEEVVEWYNSFDEAAENCGDQQFIVIFETVDNADYTLSVGESLYVKTVGEGVVFNPAAPDGYYVVESEGISGSDSSCYKLKGNTYSVKFDKNNVDATGTMANKKFTYGAKAVALTKNGFNLDGYTFIGWNTEVDGSGTPYVNGAKVKNLTTEANGEVILYAQWEANTYIVTFDANYDASTYEDTTQSFTYDAEETELDQNTFVRTGYTFDGWNRAADGSGTTYADGAKVKNLTPEADGEVTLYAQWKANTFEIVFDANGGSGTTEAVTATYDKTVKLTKNGFTKPGHEFQGWALSKKAEAARYTDEQTLRVGTVNSLYSAAKNGQKVIYAVWEAKTAEINGTYYDTFKDAALAAVNREDVVTLWQQPEDGDSVTLSKGDKLYVSLGEGAFEGVTAESLNETVGFVKVQENQENIVLTEDSPNEYTLSYQDGYFTSTHAVAALTNGANRTSYFYTFEEALAEYRNEDHKGYYSYIEVIDDVEYTMPANDAAFSVKGDISVKPDDSNSYVITKSEAEDVTTYSVTANVASVSYKYFNSTPSPVQGAEPIPVEDPLAARTEYFTTFAAAVDAAKNAEKGNYYSVEAVISLMADNPVPYTLETATGNVTEILEVTTNGFAANVVAPNGYKLYNLGTEDEAKYRAGKIFTITYTLNGGENAESNPASVTPLDEKVTLAPAVKEGYEFDSWKNGKTVVTEIDPNTTTKAITLTANYTAHNYTVVFDGNGATSGTMANQQFEYDEEAKSLTANAYKRTGYTFTGWNTAQDGTGVAYVNKASVQNLTAEDGAEFKLYAQWSENSYKITYKGNAEVVGDMSATSFKYTEGATVAENTFVRPGYTFTGWNTVAVPTEVKPGVMYREGDTYNAAANITLYAQWEANTLTISFDANGGEGTAPAAVEAKYDSDVMNGENIAKLPANPFTMTGYSFNGWNTEADGTGSSVSKNAALDGDLVNSLYNESEDGKVTLYAQWKINTITVKFDGNGSNDAAMKNETFTYNVQKALTKNTYTLENFEFRGWSTSEDGEVLYKDEEVISNPDGKISGTVTLYAVWGPVSYKIEYANVDGVDTAEWPTSYDVESVKPDGLEIPNPAKEGYTFTGWTITITNGEDVTTVSSAKDTIPAENPRVGDRVYTANWSIKSNTLTLDADGGSMKIDGSNVKTKEYTVEYGKALADYLMVAPTRSGYTFAGWDTTLETMPDEDVIVKAKWNVNTVTVKFYDGDELVATETGDYNTALTAPTMSKQGYEFGYWMNAKNVKVNTPTKFPASDTNYYAKWIGNEVTIRFMNGTSIIKTFTVENGASITPPTVENIEQVVVVPEGKILDPADLWTTEVVNPVFGSATYQLKMKDLWTVSFEANGVTLKTIPNIMDGETIEENVAPDVKKAGNAPSAWLINGEEGNIFTFGVTKVTSNMTLVATWDEEPVVKTYTVKFVNADGTELQSGEVAEGETPVYSGETPTKAEDDEFTYSFDGWTPEITAASADATYTATFTATAKEPVAHEHSWVYSAIDWDENDDGVFGAYITYVCDCGEEEEEFVAASSSVSKGVRTYTVTDKFGDTYTETIELTYTVIFNGVKQSIDYKWGQVCLLSSDDGEAKLWKANGQTVADGVNSYSFAVNSNIEITTEATENTAPVAAVAATLVSESTRTAEFNAMWSIPGNATVNKVTIYRGSSSVDKTVDADTLMSKGSELDVNLLVRNGSFCLKLSDLTSGKYQHVVIVIDYTDANGAQQLVSAVQKIQIK